MARPIKETPILTGKDAKRFEKAIASPKPLPLQQVEAARRSYERLKSVSNFAF